MNNKFNRKAPNWPTDPRALKYLERQIEFENLGEVPVVVSPNAVARYLVTYMNSQTRSRIRSATVVSVTNQSSATNQVFVSYFKGLTSNSSPVCVCAYSIPPDFTIDFCSRDLPIEITCCNCVCSPALDYDEGRAIVSSMLPQIGVSSRVYYTEGDKDEKLLAITDSKIVVFGKGNIGD
jgi:hypothetical protein